MNLVIDDAVEVKLANKTDEETRRELGMSYYTSQNFQEHANFKSRTDPIERRQCIANTSFAIRKKMGSASEWDADVVLFLCMGDNG